MPSENYSSADREKSLPDLFGRVINQVSTLIRQEIQLARAEAGEKMQQVTGAIMPMAAGAGMLIGGLIVLLFSLVSLLVYFDISIGWSRLIVGILAVLIGYLLVRSGTSRLSAANLAPTRTTEQLQRDAQVAKEQVR